MARYRGPRVKIVRRLGELPGLTSKVPNRTYPAGQHGPSASMQKMSQYRVRLQEKQKLRFNYGVSESQLLKYVRRARRAKGSSGENLLQLLEMRLDNTVFRLGFAPSIRAARQYVSHGLITVNGTALTIPSYRCVTNDTISSTAAPILEYSKTFGGEIPSHLKLENGKGTVQRPITRSQIALTINELLIVEYYSRKG